MAKQFWHKLPPCGVNVDDKNLRVQGVSRSISVDEAYDAITGMYGSMNEFVLIAGRLSRVEIMRILCKPTDAHCAYILYKSLLNQMVD
jgi:hypothetical protein